MQSKVSRRLTEPLASEVLEHIYGPRIVREFAKQFSYLTDINQAHLLMLHKTGLISTDIARKIAKGLLQIESEGPSAVELDPAKEDPYFNYEAKLMSVTGRDAGGRLHMGRSRNDIAPTIDRMRTRGVVLDVIESVARVRRTALERAGKYTDAVMPGYTHMQPAQPITFGFYLTALADALGRDMDRLHAALPRIDANPLGAGALAGTRFPIDRRATAAALGFSSVVPNTLDAVASRDFAWEAMSSMAMIAIVWGRVAQDFYVWSTPEFGLLTFPDRVASTSSIMPQKKNPAVLEYLKGSSSHVIGLLSTALITVKGTNFTHTADGSRESIGSFWECAEETLRSLALFDLIVSAIEPNRETMLRRIEFSAATDLADGLVAEAGMSFRDAHHVVGALVRLALDSGKSANELTSEMLDRASVDVIGSPVGWPEQKLRKYLDPIESVNARGNGGPAPSEVKLGIERQRNHLENVMAGVTATRQRLDAAREQMKHDVRALAAD